MRGTTMSDLQNNAALRTGSLDTAQDCTLADRRELALLAVERTTTSMVVTDPRQPDNPIVLANQAFLDLSGYTSDEIIGQNCRILQGPESALFDVANLRESLRRGDDRIESEFLNHRKDGSIFLNALAISAVRNEGGELLYYLGSQRDVTALRSAQDLQDNEHRLLLEVDHRAMNALALVQSVVNLSRAEDAEGLSRAIKRRIASMADAHRLLADRRWRSVCLIDLIATQTIWPVVADISYEGTPTELLAHVVQPLGLILHELMSNAKIHGALTQPDGRIVISWNTDHLALNIFWREETPTTSYAEFTDGLGLKIIRSAVAHQLGGQSTVSLHEGGLQVTIAIPEAIAPPRRLDDPLDGRYRAVNAHH